MAGSSGFEVHFVNAFFSLRTLGCRQREKILSLRRERGIRVHGRRGHPIP